MANSTRGCDLWGQIATVVNEEIEKSPDKVLKKNNYRLWKGYLHKWDNQDWIDILTAVSDIQQIKPDLFRRDQERALNKAAEILIENRQTNGRCLDTQNTKHEYWHMVMVLKELWNELQKPEPPKNTLFE